MLVVEVEATSRIIQLYAYAEYAHLTKHVMEISLKLKRS
jgi:hypothetical protein